MTLIEPDERTEFLAILRREQLSADDFELQETETTDPKTDENFGLQGYATVTRKSTRVTKEYALGYDTAWVHLFERDLKAGEFD